MYQQEQISHLQFFHAVLENGYTTSTQMMTTGNTRDSEHILVEVENNEQSDVLTRFGTSFQ